MLTVNDLKDKYNQFLNAEIAEYNGVKHMFAKANSVTDDILSTKYTQRVYTETEDVSDKSLQDVIEIVNNLSEDLKSKGYIIAPFKLQTSIKCMFHDDAETKTAYFTYYDILVDKVRYYTLVELAKYVLSELDVKLTARININYVIEYVQQYIEGDIDFELLCVNIRDKYYF